MTQGPIPVGLPPSGRGTRAEGLSLRVLRRTSGSEMDLLRVLTCFSLVCVTLDLVRPKLMEVPGFTGPRTPYEL